MQSEKLLLTCCSGRQCPTGGSGGTGAPSCSNGQDSLGMSLGKCLQILSAVSMALVMVDLTKLV